MARSLSSVAVFCGSNVGVNSKFVDCSEELGRLLASRNISLVYGGGHVGLMGTLADATLASGGYVHGVITRALELKEVAHGGLSRLDVVGTMHERKALMSDRADAFIMLPGGFGTLDEFFEAVTWTQLGIHRKPCGLLNVEGYFDPLVAFLERAASERFIQPRYGSLVLVADQARELLDQMELWEPATTEKWLDRNDA